MLTSVDVCLCCACLKLYFPALPLGALTRALGLKETDMSAAAARSDVGRIISDSSDGAQFEIVNNEVNSEGFSVVFRTEITKCHGDSWSEKCDCWVRRFSDVTKTYWIVEKTFPSAVRYVYRKRYKCQHSQLWKSEHTHRTRTRGKNCTASIDIKVKLSSKNTRHTDPYTRKGLDAEINVCFKHSHGVQVAEAYSYLKVGDKTKECFHLYFTEGMTPAAAKAYHELRLMESHDADSSLEFILADSSQNPRLRQVYYLYDLWRLRDKQFKTEGPEVTDGSQPSRRSKKAASAARSSDHDDAPPCKVPRLAEADETSGNVESTNGQQRGSAAVQYDESESEESVDCPGEVSLGTKQTDSPLRAQVKAEPEDVAMAGQFEVVNLPSTGQLAEGEPLNNSVDAISTPENQLCRLCIKNEGLVPLFQRSGAPRVIAIQAMTVTRVEVSGKDGLPARICRRCEDMLQQSFHFKLQCEVADVTLRSRVAARAVTPEVLSTAKYDAFCLLTDQLDKTLTKLNNIVSSLKKLESKDCYSAHAPDRDTAPVGGVNVKMDASSSPSSSGVEIKTEIEFEEHLSQFEGDRQQLEPCIDSTSSSEEQTDGLLSSEELPPEKTEVPGTQPLPQSLEMPVMQTSQEECGLSRLRERLQPSEPPSSTQLSGEHGTIRPGLQVKDFSSLQSAPAGNPPNLSSSAEVGGRIIPQLVKLADGSVRLYHVYVPDPCLLTPEDGQPGRLVPKGAGRGRSKKLVPAELSRVQTLQAAQAAVQAAAQHRTTIVVQAPRGRGKNTVRTSKQIRAQKRKPWRVRTELISDPLKISESLRTQALAHESSPLRSQASAEASDPLRTQELAHESDRLRMQTSAQPCKLSDTHGLSKSSEPFVTQKLSEPSETQKEKPLDQTDELVKRDALTENEQCSTQDLVETVTVKFCEHTTDTIMS